MVSFSPEIRGEATLVDLGPRGVLVAALVTGEGYGLAQDGASGALWLAPSAYGLQTTVDQLPRLQTLQGPRVLHPDNLPRFLWLPNPEKPEAARKILVKDIPTVIGTSVRFVGASLELTTGPVVVDIRGRLPWIKSLEQMPVGTDVIYATDKFPITRALFIGDRS